MRIPVKYHPVYLLAAFLGNLSRLLYRLRRRPWDEPVLARSDPRPELAPDEGTPRDARIARPVLLHAAGAIRRAG